jgi:hypothetical protein
VGWRGPKVRHDARIVAPVPSRVMLKALSPAIFVQDFERQRQFDL